MKYAAQFNTIDMRYSKTYARPTRKVRSLSAASVIESECQLRAAPTARSSSAHNPTTAATPRRSSTETSVESNGMSRRNFLGLAALSVPVLAGVCGMQQFRAEQARCGRRHRAAQCRRRRRRQGQRDLLVPVRTAPAGDPRELGQGVQRDDSKTARSPTPSSRTTRTRRRSRPRSAPARPRPSSGVGAAAG